MAHSKSNKHLVSFPHTFFSFERKYNTLDDFLAILSSDFIDHNYQHNAISQESLFAATQVSCPHLNLLNNYIPSDDKYGIFFVTFVQLWAE